MPRPKAYKPIDTKATKLDPKAATLDQSLVNKQRKPSPLLDPTIRARGRVKLDLPDRQAHAAISLDKHSASLRQKAAYAADLLAEDIIAVFKRSGKKDKEYLKGLVWSFGVLFDKATGGVSSDAVQVRIPAKLLDNVNAVIAIQVSKRLDKPTSPASPPDTGSSATVINTTGYEVPVAQGVAQHVLLHETCQAESSLASSSDSEPPPTNDRPGGTLGPGPGGHAVAGTVT